MNPPVLLYVLKTLLTLLHPFVPFVTETIWTHLEPKNLLIAEPWPKADKKLIFAKEEKFEAVIDLISAIRSIRAEKGVEPVRKISAVISGGKWIKVLEAKRGPIMRMAHLQELKLTLKAQKFPERSGNSPTASTFTCPRRICSTLERKRSVLRKNSRNPPRK